MGPQDHLNIAIRIVELGRSGILLKRRNSKYSNN